jgi:hypothetical protein
MKAGGALRFAGLVAGAVVVLANLAGPAAASGAVGHSSDWFDAVFETETGSRYWLNFGSTEKNLFSPAGDAVSRLNYKGLVGHAGELFFHTDNGRIFIKGNAGIGGLVDGQMEDEDFAPAGVHKYSNTISDQRDGLLAYGTLDVGAWPWIWAGGRLGGFVGYNLTDETVNSYGCLQRASNNLICQPEIDTSVLAITQNNYWHSARVGAALETELGPRWSLSAEGAILPFVYLDGYDSHWLRICQQGGCLRGAIPEDGTGWGYQIEANLDYRVSSRLSLGLGGRIWHMETSGTSHFENRVIGTDRTGTPQPVDWSTDLYGLLVHVKARL